MPRARALLASLLLISACQACQSRPMKGHGCGGMWRDPPAARAAPAPAPAGERLCAWEAFPGHHGAHREGVAGGVQQVEALWARLVASGFEPPAPMPEDPQELGPELRELGSERTVTIHCCCDVVLGVVGWCGGRSAVQITAETLVELADAALGAPEGGPSWVEVHRGQLVVVGLQDEHSRIHELLTRLRAILYAKVNGEAER